MSNILVTLVVTILSQSDPAAATTGESRFLSHARQLTFDGRRSGEGYFSADGTKMVFQSEREPGNPFYQIYLLDLETGDTERISTGTGKTTCAWLHPSGNLALFASTHEDPGAKAEQERELGDRAEGKEKRYAWDYDEHYELYEKDLPGGGLRRLTDAVGYDAEGCYSPDGTKIVFASNRHAYSGELSEGDAKLFAHDKSYLMDIYIMDEDGSNVRRLTDVAGYDGGPFFSADGKKVCWRRFTPDGATAEVFTMNADGSEQRAITEVGAMSWAPYFHPSGEYLIFTTNVHGFANFELYIVDAAGGQQPVRVTTTEGFDGLPVFSPDGAKLAWTSNRTASGESQIFIAHWDHAAARAALQQAAPVATAVASGSPQVSREDLKQHVEALASERMEGRLTGTEGERRATEYVAEAFKAAGLAPAGEGGGYFQPFEFTAGVSLGEGNALGLEALSTGGDVRSLKEFEVDQDWRPLAFSRTGRVEPTEVVFAGYGIVAPKAEGQEEYDSYVHTDVKGKWVMVLRFMPEEVTPERRQHLSRYASLRHKAMVARDRGAVGIIVVSGPTAKVREQLVPLAFDAALAGTSIAAVSVTDEAASVLLGPSEKKLPEVQAQLDKGEMVMGFELPTRKLGAAIDMRLEKRTGRNVLARLSAGDAPGETAVVVGGHVDHLGRGKHSGSLAHKDDGEDAIHYGADDNASGIAATLEIAQHLVDLKKQGKLKLKHDIVFAAWSGEELGLLGSSHFVQELRTPDGKLPGVIACLNMDMVGRYREKLTLQGAGSSPAWAGLIERANVPVGLSLTVVGDSYLPTDSTSFYIAGVPSLSIFTGAHEEYHTPRDTPEKLNYDGLEKVTRFVGLLARGLATSEQPPAYVAQSKPDSGPRGGGLRAYLGSIPDYAQDESVKGVKLSGVAKGGPADKAGVRAGDVIVELAGKKIENIYDYTYAIEALKIGQEATITVRRGEERKELKVTPGSRE